MAVLTILRRRKILVAAAVFALGAVGFFALLNGLARNSESESQAFVAVFGVKPPKAINEVKVNQWSRGMFDSPSIAMNFHADREAIDALLETQKFVSNDEMVNRYKAGEIDWDELWKNIFPPLQGGKRMVAPPPLPHAVLFERINFDRDGKIVIGGARVLWDSDTGNAWVLRFGDVDAPLPEADETASPTTAIAIQ